MTDNSLEQQALTQLNAKHYKEAIELYKQLWEISEDKKWQQQLAHCYLLRALSFSEREMIREALLQWEKYIHYAEAPYDYYDRYIGWLIQSGDQKNLKRALQQLSAQQLDQQYPELSVSLGLLMLTEHSEFQHYLPEDSIFIRHFKLAHSAWQAYQSNNQGELNTCLKQLPYRSAFKDFRLILTAFQHFPQTIEDTVTKIAKTSPYTLSINLLHACTLNGSALLEKLTAFNYSQRSLIAEIKGLDNQQQQFIESYIPHHGGLTAKIEFNLALQYQSLIGTELACDFCQAMLAHYPAGQGDLNKQFDAVNHFESNRIQALANEREGNYKKADNFWRQCINQLSATDEDNIKKALILRHIAALKNDPHESTPLLIESLDYDGDDLASYQQILHYFEQEPETYEKWLVKTLKNFPDNLEVLTQAIKIATQNQQHKKINHYALQIITIDPLNTFAKETLLTNYLAEARQLIQDKAYPAADKKITEAESLTLDKKQQAQTQLIRGFYIIAKQDKKQGLALVYNSLNELNHDPVNRYFQATMEALLTGLPVADILENLDYTPDYLLSEQELTRVTQQLKQYGKEFEHQLLLLKAIEKINPALKKSLSQQTYNETQWLALSEILSQVNDFDLLHHCVTLALDKWSTPIWQYYQLYSAKKGMPEKCNSQDITNLKTSRELTIKEKDNRTRILIDSFLDDYNHAQSSTGMIEDLLDFNRDKNSTIFDDPLEHLFNQIPEDKLINLTDETEALTLTTTPEQLVDALIKQSDHQQAVLHAMMVQPDLYSALLVIKAADSLGIKIKSSATDVLKSFEVIL